MARPLLVAAFVVAALMSAYEVLKQLLFPRITIWQSHLVTICFTTALALLTAHFLGRRLTALNRRLQADILERDQISKALEQSAARYRHLFESNKAGVYLSSPEKGFVDCNEAFARMFGYERQELLKLHPSILYVGGPEERDSRLADLRKAGQFNDYEIAFRHKNGNLVWVIQNAAMVKDEGGKELSEGTVVDVTERHLLEDRLRQSQKMEAIGRLAGGISHDFNNLLTVVLGYITLLGDHVTDAEAREQIDYIAEAARKASALTRQLLAFSRQQVLEPTIINVNALLTNLEKLLRRVIGEDIELVTTTAPKLRNVKADANQLEQVIINLAINARDAMPRGGKLTLETANVDLDESYAASHAGATSGAHVVLAVSDTGRGMPPEVQARIFDPFFTTKELGRGTGLGLSTVYGIVQQSGGHIWVYSEVDHGTTFKIYLPATGEKPGPANREIPVTRSTHGKETVLLVEDDRQVRDLARAVLAQRGYSVLAPDGSSAVASTAEQNAMSIHLLLTDIIMPGINGRDLARQLLERNPEIRVLYMSGYTENVAGEHGVLDPGNHFLQKPFTPTSLADKVREVLDGPAKG